MAALAGGVLFAVLCILSIPAWCRAAEEDGSRPEVSSDLGELRSHLFGFRDLVGSLRAERVTYWEFPPATNVRSSFTVTAEGDWRFRNITADFCGGRISASAGVHFMPADASAPPRAKDAGRAGASGTPAAGDPAGGRPGSPPVAGQDPSLLVRRRPRRKVRRFDYRADCVGARLEDFTRHVEFAVTPGIVSGHVDVSMTAEGVKGLSGEARAHLRDGNLGRFPLVLKVLSFLTLSFPGLDQEDIEEADAHITLTPRAARFKHLVMRTRDGGFALKAERLGEVAYDGKIDIYFRPVFESSFLKSLPVVGGVIDKVLEDIKQRGLRVRVTGTAAEPRFQWAAFRFVR